LEFIAELSRVCLRFITSRRYSPRPGHLFPASYARYPSLAQIHAFISDSGITSTQLALEDVAMFVTRLIHDGQVEKIVKPVAYCLNDEPENDEDDPEDLEDDLFMYRAVKSTLADSSLASIPCGACKVNFFFCFFFFTFLTQVFKLCSDKAPISPSNCEYFQNWL
jgi:DNA-directed RNA polymerase III subunit RPC6